MPKDAPELKTQSLAETENYQLWRVEEPDGEVTYNLLLNNVTLHFFQEEWDEFIDLFLPLSEASSGDIPDIEFRNVTLHFSPQDWQEFLELLKNMLHE